MSLSQICNLCLNVVDDGLDYCPECDDDSVFDMDCEPWSACDTADTLDDDIELLVIMGEL